MSEYRIESADNGQINITTPGRRNLDIVNKYIHTIYLKNMSRNYILATARHLIHYQDFLDENSLCFEDVLMFDFEAQLLHFTQYREWLHNGNHSERRVQITYRTVNNYYKTVIRFYGFLEAYNYAPLKTVYSTGYAYDDINGIARQKNQKKELIKDHTYNLRATRVKVASQEEVYILQQNARNIRDRLIIAVLKAVAFRIGELLSLEINDFNETSNTIRVKYHSPNNGRGEAQKNAEERTLPIPESTAKELAQYIADTEGIRITDKIFICEKGKTKGKPMTRKTVYKMLDRLADRTGVRLRPHDIRRMTASMWHQASIPLPEISTALGHRYLQTTADYIHISEQAVIEAGKRVFDQQKELMKEDNS